MVVGSDVVIGGGSSCGSFDLLGERFPFSISHGTIFCDAFLALMLHMSLLFAVTASDIGFAIRIRFPKQMTEIAMEQRLALSLTDRVNRSNFIIAKIIIGFIVGCDSGIVFIINCGDLTSLEILVNGFEPNGKSHGLIQRVFVGLHNFATNRFVEASQKQLMLEELLSITNPFSFELGKVGGSHGNS